MPQIRANLRTAREEKYYWHLCVMNLRSVWDNLTSKSNTGYGNTIPPVFPQIPCAPVVLTYYSSEKTNNRNWFTFPVFLRVVWSDLTAGVRCIAVVHGSDSLQLFLVDWLSVTLLWWHPQQYDESWWNYQPVNWARHVSWDTDAHFRPLKRKRRQRDFIEFEISPLPGLGCIPIIAMYSYYCFL